MLCFSRGGKYSRGNSRASSPSRSVRGGSPQSSRGNSRRSSPSNYSRNNSPSRQTRVFSAQQFRQRNTSPGRQSMRSTVSRTPSPPRSYNRGGGRGGGNRGRNDRGGYKKDSRDLEGWSRQDNYDRSNRRGENKIFDAEIFLIIYNVQMNCGIPVGSLHQGNPSLVQELLIRILCHQDFNETMKKTSETAETEILLITETLEMETMSESSEITEMVEMLHSRETPEM